MAGMTKFIEWVEPYADSGGDNYLPVTCRAEWKDVVKFMRRREPRYDLDEVPDALVVEDFCVIYWAEVVEVEEVEKRSWST